MNFRLNEYFLSSYFRNLVRLVNNLSLNSFNGFIDCIFIKIFELRREMFSLGYDFSPSTAFER